MNSTHKTTILTGIHLVFYDIIFTFILQRGIATKETSSFAYNNLLLHNLCMYD